MDWNTVLEWLAGSSAAMALFRALKMWPRSKALIGILAAILILLLSLRAIWPDTAGWITAALLVTFLIIPTRLNLSAAKFVLQQRYSAAARASRIAAILLPTPQVRRNAQTCRAMDLLHRNQIDAANQIFEQLAQLPPPASHLARINLFVIRQQWTELAEWMKANFPEERLRRQPALVVTFARALAEIGQTGAMLELIDRYRGALDARIQFRNRATCRVIAFAFCGQIDRVQTILAGPLTIITAPNKQFWLATAEMTAGHIEAGRARLAPYQQTESPRMRAAIARRIESPPAPPVLAPREVEILDTLDREREQETRFSPYSRTDFRPWATFLLVAANLVMFGIETIQGGSSNLQTLWRLGAFDPIETARGQYWRLISAQFLHFGTAHLILNMLALLYLGPFVEMTFGSAIFVVYYLLSGALSFAFLWEMQNLHITRMEIAVGASGAIMALVGGTIAILIRGLAQERGRILQRRLLAMGGLIGFQMVFDLLTPQVAMSAHLSGLMIGLLLGLVIPRKKAVLPANPVAAM